MLRVWFDSASFFDRTEMARVTPRRARPGFSSVEGVMSADKVVRFDEEP
jgi:hypothetical protein